MLSVVAPMFNESEGLSAFFARVTVVLEGITPEWEIVCVNDGSTDNTLELLKQQHAREPRVRYLSLSRNFGKEAALTAGLHHARGQAVVPIDADLQDPPELIPEMVALWHQGFKVVLATRRQRVGEDWLKRFTARGFYWLMSHLARFDIPENTGDFRLMDASVLAIIRQMPERTRFMKGLFAWAGFRTAQVMYDRPARAAGAAKQDYSRLWRLAKDGIFSFTTLPLRITTYMGALLSAYSIAYAFYLAIRTLVRGIDVPGYASLMTAVLFIGGVQLLSIGIVGEYIGRIYRETKQRPLFVVEESSESHAQP